MRHKLGLRMAILLALLGGAAGMMFVNFYEVEVTRQRLDQARSTMQEGLRLAEFLEGLGLALGAGGEEGRIVRRALEQAAEDVLGLQRRTGLRALPHDVRGPLGEVAQRAELLADRGFDVADRGRQGEALRLEVRDAAQRLRLALDELEKKSAGNIKSILKRQLLLLAVVGGCLVLLALVVFLPMARAVFEMRREINESRETLRQLSVIDPLTKAFNRRKLQEACLLEIERARRYRAPLSALMLDIDYYRALNDALGYEGGDRLLADLAELIRRSVRITDILFRWRGGRFLVLAPHIDAAQAARFAEKLRSVVEQADLAPGRKATISIGYGQHKPGENLDGFVNRLKRALAQAKAQGRNQCVMAPVLDEN
ncbi:MAG: GGDEF domain-containing protein [Desulfovibrionaceae bacterium]